jgi:hypothetical protein
VREEHTSPVLIEKQEKLNQLIPLFITQGIIQHPIAQKSLLNLGAPSLPLSSPLFSSLLLSSLFAPLFSLFLLLLKSRSASNGERIAWSIWFRL